MGNKSSSLKNSKTASPDNSLLQNQNSKDMMESLSRGACAIVAESLSSSTGIGSSSSQKDDVIYQICHEAATMQVNSQPVKGSLKITVEDEEWKYDLFIQATTTIQHLKIILKAQHAVDVSNKQLVYGGYVLQENKTLQDYNILSGYVLQLSMNEEDYKSPAGKINRLIRASAEGDMKTVKDILATGVDVNDTGKNARNKGRRAIHAAAERGHYEVVSFLRKVGAAVNITDDNGLTPLHVSALGGHPTVCRILLEEGATVDTKAQGMKLFHYAAAGGHVELLEFLRELCDIHEQTDDEMTSLHLAALHGKLEAVYWLVEMGINFNLRDKKGRTAEGLARENGYDDIATYLFNWALHQQRKFLKVAATGNMPSVLSFFNIGIDIECKSQNEGDWGFRAIHVAALHGHTEVVNALLFAGARREAVDDMGSTAMHFAANGGQIGVMKMLKNEGCRVEVCNNLNMTPLHFAAMGGELAAASWLLAQGVKANIVANNGLTALAIAQKGKHNALADVLLKHQGTQAKKETSADDLRLGRKLGQGSFGEVFLATLNNREIVVKKVKITAKNEREIEFTARELVLLKHLKHPNIVTYMNDKREDGHLFIMMEYCSGGDLNQKITEQRSLGKPFEEKLVLNWTSRIASALTYIHGRRVLHRDLKPHNIFLASSGAIKVGDFGLAKVLDETALTQSFVGAPAYMSPEVLSNTPYGDKADMWSFGCILYELAALKMGFPYINVNVPGKFCADYKNLVVSLLNFNPAKRPSAAEVWRLPFLKPGEPKKEQKHQSQHQQQSQQLHSINQEIKGPLEAMIKWLQKM